MSVAEETAAVVDQLPPSKAQSVLDFARFLAEHPTRDSTDSFSVPENAEITDLSQRLLKRAGKVDGLPADMAQQHDHYIHGIAKR